MHVDSPDGLSVELLRVPEFPHGIDIVELAARASSGVAFLRDVVEEEDCDASHPRALRVGIGPACDIGRAILVEASRADAVDPRVDDTSAGLISSSSSSNSVEASSDNGIEGN